MVILLNPGPVVLSERVRKALGKPDLCHREQEFIDLQNKIKTDLLDVYQLPADKWASIVFTGSGTSAMEAMMTSLIPSHGKVLIIENGIYGERLTKIANMHNIEHVVLHHEWGEEIDLEKLEGELRYHEELSHVAVVHHETTTGRLNNIDVISELCKKYRNVPILLDGVSSFAAEEIKFEEWNIAACAATANKCCHAVPGTSFVIANREAMQQMSATPARTLYLDLVTYLNAQDNNGTPFTQSVQTFYALAEALDELKDKGGWEKRQQQYWKLMDIVRNGLDKLNIKAYFDKEDCSCVLNAFQLPEGVNYQELHDKLKAVGFVIYAGQGGFEKSLFRISCMGEISESDMERFTDEMGKIINS
ncbi:MAG TPA: 2-aminoethylphosphonate aminotransferase [Thiotrichaceae bacterium]|jgi:2-aminoethylphosphonate-pyruvate transaminase|nr:2-aminoethylphosphonate aminotransferase [Thiotrichaceae bacterium]HIM08973.1 2-aminoethylphosphonate aminotransferase [Gammaproteobacteria bacterium]